MLLPTGYFNGYCRPLLEFKVKRILVVYNPRSSRYDSVKQEVLDKTTKLSGYLVGKYEIENTDIESNIKKLAKIIKQDDLIITAGGDATSLIATNAILRSGTDAKIAVLPYGNFNDLSRTLGVSKFEEIFSSSAQTKKYYPLEIYVDNKLIRYSTCYITIGMTAESVKIYDEPKIRLKLKTSFGRKVSSYIVIAKWYFKNRHRKIFLPDFKFNGKKVPAKTSDYIAVNGHYLARVMRGGDSYLDPYSFESGTYRLTSFFRLFKMMVTSILHHVPGSLTQDDVLEFDQPANIILQAEGESIALNEINRIEIKKAKQYLKVIVL